MTSDGEKLQGEKNGSVYTLTVYDARNTTYPLGMSGEDVKNRLKKVDLLDTLNADSTTHGSIQNSISIEIDTHDRSTSAHPNLVRAGTSDAKEYEAYKGKNTVEDIVKVIRSEMEKVSGVTSDTVTNMISAHNLSGDNDLHPSLVEKINASKDSLTKEIARVEGLISDEKTGLNTQIKELNDKFDNLDKNYVNESELQEKLNTQVLGFDRSDVEQNKTYGSYTIKK